MLRVWYSGLRGGILRGWLRTGGSLNLSISAVDGHDIRLDHRLNNALGRDRIGPVGIGAVGPVRINRLDPFAFWMGRAGVGGGRGRRVARFARILHRRRGRQIDREVRGRVLRGLQF